MKKTITFVLGVFILFPVAADDISYIEEYEALPITEEEREENLSDTRDSQVSSWMNEEFKPWFLAKEIVKICHQAREGMLKVYYSPVQYTEAIDSFNRQMEKFAATMEEDDIPRAYIGVMELSVLDSRAYTFQKSLINSMSFNEGYKECNMWRGALLATEYGL
ncbi:hypothetical protein N9J68_01955 [Gammaproteobacteria bacterium]|nr:hypothetical protein [Gammaproteobacteria bacterium]MDA9010988.1 hypothetical protein [Gammaproteobacteria bacterium]MDA9117828.1 hypothetical protein [Gammaproteobacteria bacterium]